MDYKDTRHIEHDNRNDSKIEEKSNTGPQQDFSVPTTENHLIDLRSPIFCSKDYPIEIVAADSAPLSLLAPIRNIEPPKEKPPRLPEEVPDDPVDVRFLVLHYSFALHCIFRDNYSNMQCGILLSRNVNPPRSGQIQRVEYETSFNRSDPVFWVLMTII